MMRKKKKYCKEWVIIISMKRNSQCSTKEYFTHLHVSSTVKIFSISKSVALPFTSQHTLFSYILHLGSPYVLDIIVLTLEQGRTRAFSWNLNAIHMPRTTKFVLTKELTSMHLNASEFICICACGGFVGLAWRGGWDCFGFCFFVAALRFTLYITLLESDNAL